MTAGKKPKHTTIRKPLSTLAVNLRLARGRRGLTQAELAQAAGTSARAIGRIEQGEAVPGVVTLGKLAEALKTTIEALDPTTYTPDPETDIDDGI